MSGRFAASNRVAIVGYAQSPVRRKAEHGLGALAADTARSAIADAGLRVADVDGFVASGMLPSAGAHTARDGVTTVSPGWMARTLGAEPSYVAGFDGIGQLSGSMAMAVNAVAAGAADYVLVHRALHNPAGSYHDNPLREAAGTHQWTAPQGYFGPLAAIALPCQEYFHRFGADREALAAIVVEARKNGARHRWSCWYERPLTREEYLDAPMLSDPICRYDCDIPVDGVAAFVLTSRERAADLPHRPVHIAGYAQSAPPRHRLPLHWPLDDILESGRATADRLYEHAGIGPGEIDLPQVYDGFSPFVWFWLEALGLCPPGQAHRFISDGGIDSDRPGALPVLSSGGALGNGRMHGVPQLLECYLRLSRRADARGRPSATTAVACASSPHYGGALALSAEPY
ncbi:MAG: thiolase family protein [Nocardia sp.]|nr:thiolase family protein [Nocardia sp.]